MLIHVDSNFGIAQILTNLDTPEFIFFAKRDILTIQGFFGPNL